MKNFIIVLFFLFAVTACNKFDFDCEKNILGEWSFVNGESCSLICENGEYHIVDRCYGCARTDVKLLRFEKNNRMYVNGDSVYSYRVDGNDLVCQKIGGEKTIVTLYSIEKLTEKELVISLSFNVIPGQRKNKAIFYYVKV